MATQPRVHGNRHMTASGHLLATQAGFEIFEMGGNAIDAGVAAGLALGVVHSDMVQFAGVAPIMIYLAERREVVTISGLGGWPMAASIDRFIDDYGGTIPEGVLRTVVPAAPDAWIRAIELYGTLSFAEIAAPAIRLAAQGFPMHHVMRDYIEANAASYRRWPQNSAIFLPDDKVPALGAPFVQSDLAATIQFLADEERAARANATKGNRVAGLRAARDAFYRGDLAHTISEFHRENGGWLTRGDLAEFESAVEPALKTTFQGVDVYTCGPWCQGPVLQQSLALLRGENLSAAKHNSVEYIHLIAEATKLAFADREHYYGDPRFVDVPIDALLEQRYNRERRALIDPKRAHPGTPEPGCTDGFPHPTSHPMAGAALGSPGASADTSFACTADAMGNLFSATPSDVSWEAPIIPGTGLCPSTRGSQSWAVRGHASSIAPGKRPRLTPNPALAIAPGQYAMPFGTPGGDNQTQAMLQVLLNYHVFGMPIQDAIEAPRFMSHSFANSFEPHACYPGKLTVEGRVSEETTAALSALGHDVERLEDMTYQTAGVCAIVRDEVSGLLEGGADPRRMSRALGR